MVFGGEPIGLCGALSRYGDDDGLAVVHGERGVLDEDLDVRSLDPLSVPGLT